MSELVDGGTHVVLIDNSFGDDRFPVIMLDDAAVGRMAAKHLYDRGHRELCVVYDGDHRPFKLRREGFAEALSSLGLAAGAGSLLVDRRGGAEEALYAALAEGGPTAYFCANDEIAVALYRAASRRGLSIPRDLSVIGVDDSDYAALPGIDLTSISHPSPFIGAKPAQLLMDAIAAPGLSFKSAITIDPVMVERGSVRSIR